MVKTILVLMVIMSLIMFVSTAPSGFRKFVTDNLKKVKHIVVIMQENHSFDNYFSLFPNADGIKNYPEWARKLAHPVSYLTHDLCHSHKCSLKYYDNGKMDGWNDYEAFGYFNSSTLSYYWELARNYTLLDNYFSDFMGPTLPNRLYSISGTNYNITEDFQGHPEYYNSIKGKTIFDLMQQKGISWSMYIPCSGCNMDPLAAFSNHGDYYKHVHNSFEFFEHLQSGRLDNFVMIGLPDPFNEHPVQDVRDGVAQVRSIITSIQNSKFWSSTVIIFTYDESGGFYDHVAPPNGTYGFRVPTIIISPLAKHHVVYHNFASHSSILALVEKVFNLNCLSRDCHSNNLSELFPKLICYVSYAHDFQRVVRHICTEQ